MAQNFDVSDLVNQTSLPQLKYQCPMIMTADRTYHETFDQDLYQPGSSIKIRYPNFWRIQVGQVMPVQGWNEADISLNVGVPIGGNWAADVNEATLFMTKDYKLWQKRYIAPIITTAAAYIENDALSHLETEVNYFAGSPTASFSSFTLVDLINAQFTELGIPKDGDLSLVLDPRTMSALKSENQNAFNPTLNDDITWYSRLGHYSKFNLYETSSVRIHTCGTGAGTPQVNGLFSGGMVIPLKGFTPNAANVITKGDILTFGSLSDDTGIQSINNAGQTTTGQLMSVTSSANYNADGSGNINNFTIAAPALGLISDPSSQRTNISQPIADGTSVNIIGADGQYKIGAAYASRGLAMVFPRMVKNHAVVCINVEDPIARIGFRVSRGYDQLTGLDGLRTEIIYGIRFFDQYAVKVISKV